MEDESRSVSGFLHFDTASKGKHYGCWLFLGKVFLILNGGRATSRKDTEKENNRFSKQQQYMG